MVKPNFQKNELSSVNSNQAMFMFTVAVSQLVKNMAACTGKTITGELFYQVYQLFRFHYYLNYHKSDVNSAGCSTSGRLKSSSSLCLDSELSTHGTQDQNYLYVILDCTL